jgi:hypothetical protein
MIIDCILFDSELDMLEGRLETLGDYVDKFVIVESDHQFQNQYKGWVLEANFERFKKFHDKIIYHKKPSVKDLNPWLNEARQRRGFEDVLHKLNLSDDAIVTVCDTDEFWKPSEVVNLPEPIMTMNNRKFHMSLYWYHKHEINGVIGRWGHIKNGDLDFLRRSMRQSFPHLSGGQHFTSMGSYQDLVRKMKGFAHSEFRTQGMEETLLDCWTNGHFYGQPFTELDFDDETPTWVKEFRFPENWYRKRPQTR